MTQAALAFDDAATMRHSYNRELRKWFEQHPGEEVEAWWLAAHFGAYAWRTRCSVVRRQLESEGLGTITNRQIHETGKPTRSLYRYDKTEGGVR